MSALKPLVSVCIPAYKQTEYLRKTLESLLMQTYTDFEVVITDDSPDDSVANLVHSFDFGGRMHYYRNAVPLGSPANWNASVDKSQGDLIKIMHHDDWFTHANSLRDFVSLLDTHPEADFAFCATRVLDVRDGSYTLHAPTADQVQEVQNDPRILLYHHNIIGAPSATLYRRTAALRYDERIQYVVDVDFYIRVLQQTNKLVYSPEPLIVNTSQSENQVTQASLDRKTQVGEYTYLYNKVKKGRWPEKKDLLFFRQLFLQYKVKSMGEYAGFGFGKPRPALVFYLLILYLRLARRYSHA
jgi:glycosyltransferase involved in cell wall biosynthesis